MIRIQFHKTIEVIRSDNGAEFICIKFFFFNENGILQQTSVIGTPQQNKKAERKHRHIHNVAQALHFQEKLTKTVLRGVYVDSRLPYKSDPFLAFTRNISFRIASWSYTFLLSNKHL